MNVAHWVRHQVYWFLKSQKGSKTFDYLHFFLQHQYDTFETLNAWRWRHVETLIQEAFQFVPGYRQRLEELNWQAIGPYHPAGFSQIPPLTRDDLVYDHSSFIHTGGESRHAVTIQTGGSTGTPVTLVHSRNFRDWLQAATFFYNTWGGLELGKPYFMLWAAYEDIQPQMQNWRERIVQGGLQNRKVMNCRVTSCDLMLRFARQIQRERNTRHLVGYANEVEALALVCEHAGLKMQGSLDAIYVTASTLTSLMQARIESVFGCRVYNRYGCRDAGEIAFSCPYQRGLHINPMYALVEIADAEGCPLPYGQEGQILLTVLHNYAMPLIRYAVGDLGVLDPPELCPCGRTWETLRHVTGRVNESLCLPGGARLGGGVLYTAFEYLPYLQRFQIHQYGDVPVLTIKLRSHVDHYVTRYAEELQHTVSRLYDLTGCEFDVRFEQTSDFHRTPTGKELFVVRHPQPVAVEQPPAEHVPV